MALVDPRVFQDLVAGLPAIPAVMAIAAMPVAEVRVSVPVAIAAYKMGTLEACFWSTLGCMAPAPFILHLFEWGRNLLKPYPPFSWVLDSLDKKAEASREDYETWGPRALFGFVVLPLPGTGVWTGAAVATLLKVPHGATYLVLFLGVLVELVVMVLFTHGGMLALGVARG